jgi:cytochrome c oxidase subunit II
MFSGNSNFVQGVDTAFVVIIGISVLFLVGITAFMLYAVIRYNKKRSPKSEYIDGSTKLEIIWTIIPTILAMGMFYFGYVAYAPMRNAPENALKIKVNSRMWAFSFEYANGKTSDTLYVPAGQPVYLDMVSYDVIHSFYIPSFRVKEDIVPGKKNFVWFQSDKVGKYDLFCTEYCGMRHSYMITAVRVMEPAEYKEWYGNEASLVPGQELSPEELASLEGLEILKRNACISCHSTDGSKLVGPSFLGILGRTESVIKEDGSKAQITVDEEYLKRSIWKPNAEIVEGYPKSVMQSYETSISAEEIQKIITYFKSLDE